MSVAAGVCTVHRFSAPLQRISVKGGSHLVVVPPDIADDIRQGGRRGRAVATLDDVTWHCGLNPYGGGRFYIQVGRNYFEPLGYVIGDTLSLQLTRDTSDFGMQPCEEFLAVAESDPEGLRRFRENLTGGTQRTLLHRIAGATTSDGRIERALKVFDLLVRGETERQALLRSVRAGAMRGEE